MAKHWMTALAALACITESGRAEPAPQIPASNVAVNSPCGDAAWLDARFVGTGLIMPKQIELTVSVTTTGYFGRVTIDSMTREFAGAACDEVMEAAWVIIAIASEEASLSATPVGEERDVQAERGAVRRPTTVPMTRPPTDYLAVGISVGAAFGILPSTRLMAAPRLWVNSDTLVLQGSVNWLAPEMLAYDTRVAPLRLTAWMAAASACSTGRWYGCVGGELGSIIARSVTFPDGRSASFSSATATVGRRGDVGSAHTRWQWAVELTPVWHLAQPVIEPTPGNVLFKTHSAGLRATVGALWRL